MATSVMWCVVRVLLTARDMACVLAENANVTLVSQVRIVLSSLPWPRALTTARVMVAVRGRMQQLPSAACVIRAILDPTVREPPLSAPAIALHAGTVGAMANALASRASRALPVSKLCQCVRTWIIVRRMEHVLTAPVVATLASRVPRVLLPATREEATTLSDATRTDAMDDASECRTTHRPCACASLSGRALLARQPRQAV